MEIEGGVFVANPTCSAPRCLEPIMYQTCEHLGKSALALVASLAAALCSCAAPAVSQPGVAPHAAPPGQGFSAGPAMAVPYEHAPYQPSGQWIPPGIAGPWPAGEYVRDGGDRRGGARLGEHNDLLNLDTEDTVATYRDERGETHVVASNRVHLYAPRFAAVRSVSSTATQQSIDAFGRTQQRTLGAVARARHASAAHTERLAAELIDTRKRASGFESEQYAGEVSDERHAQSAEVALLPYEARHHVEGLTVRQKERAGVTEGTQAAVVWARDSMAQAVVRLEGGIEVISEAAAQETITIDERPRAPGTIQLVKEASTSAANSGETIEFVLRYENVGGKPIESVTILDNLSRRLEYVADSVQSDRPAQFTAQDNGDGSSILRWVLDGTLEAGQGGILRFKVKVR